MILFCCFCCSSFFVFGTGPRATAACNAYTSQSCEKGDASDGAKAALKKARNLRAFLRNLEDKPQRAEIEGRIAPVEAALLASSSTIKFATGSGYIRFMLGHVNVKVFTVKEKSTLRDECVRAVRSFVRSFVRSCVRECVRFVVWHVSTV